MALYLKIFIEAIITSSFVPFAHEPAFFAMSSFASAGYDYDISLAVALAVAGSLVGTLLCFMVGRWLSKLYNIEGDQKHLTLEKYNSAARSFSRYFTVLLLFTWMPLLNLLPLVAGFLSIRAKVVFPLVIIGKITYYGYHTMY